MKHHRYSSKEEFIQETAEYLKRVIPALIEQGEFKYTDSIKEEKVKRSLVLFIGLTKYDGNDKDEEIVEIGSSILSLSVSNWAKTGLSEDTPVQELIIRAIIDSYILDSVSSTLATCYLYGNTNIDEDFIEDIIYINSGLFKFEEWDDEHVKVVTECAAAQINPKMYKPLIDLYGKDRLEAAFGLKQKHDTSININFPIGNFRGRVSKEFAKKYENEYSEYAKRQMSKANGTEDED